MIGIGFCCPPASAFESSLLGGNILLDDLHRDESLILANANRILSAQNVAPLTRMAALFEEVDETFLTTYAELDHFPIRPVPRYYGSLSVRVGEPVEWPEPTFRNVFIYTRKFPVLESLLHYISRSQITALVFSEDPLSDSARNASPDQIRLLQHGFDVAQIASSCDLAITNGNHGVTSAMLLAGKPVLIVPTVTEQYMIGQRIAVLGAGEMAMPDDLDGAIGGLLRLLRNDGFAAMARQFRDRYSHFDSEKTAAQIVTRIEELVSSE